MTEKDARRSAGVVRQYLADYRLACFARDLLETRSVAAAVRKEE